MKNYYTLLIETKEKISSRKEEEENSVLKKECEFINTRKSMNKIVTDDGFDNCSNFIK